MIVERADQISTLIHKTESADFGNDFAVFNSGFVTILSESLIEAMLAVADVKLPAVPWAGDDISTQLPFPQRASGVRTDAVEHMKYAVDVIDCENSAICHNFRTTARRDRCDVDQRDCCHSSLLLLLHRL